MRNTSDLPTLSPWFPCLLEQRFYELNKMRIGMMSLLCMMHLTVLVCSKSCGQRVNGHDFCPLHSGWWLWTVVFLCLGPVWNHFWNQVSAKLSSTRNLRRRPQRLRLSKVGPKAGVELDVTKVGFQKISRFFPKTYGSRVPSCLQTRPFHGCQMLAARSSKISGASCGIC